MEVYNLGTGKGYSVLDIVKAFERVNDVKIPYVIDDRRPGDIATCYSDPSKAWTGLGWKAEYGIEEMCRDSWNWQRKNNINASNAPKNFVCVFFFGKYGMGLSELKQILTDSYQDTMVSCEDPYNALNNVLARVDDTVDFELAAWRKVAIEYAHVSSTVCA